jgi:hypothetical protein
MTTEFNIFRSDEVELTLDTKGALELDIEYSHRDYFGLTNTPRGALDIATRLIYGVWVMDPELAEQRIAELAKDIPAVYNLMERHRD